MRFQSPYVYIRTSTGSPQKHDTFGPVYEISVLIAFAPLPLINGHADVSSDAIGLKFGMSLHLHPYFFSEQRKLR